jgi:hypothetical protein
MSEHSATRTTMVSAASTVPLIPVIDRTTGQVINPAPGARPAHACGAACVNATTPLASCTCDCGGVDHGAAHRRIPTPSTPASQAAAFARLPALLDEEPF